MNSVPCSVCSQPGHAAWKCPTLVEPLKPGFHSGGGGGGGHSHDEDDEKATKTKPVPPTLCYYIEKERGKAGSFPNSTL